jgi:AraC-like DNA-binding protein
MSVVCRAATLTHFEQIATECGLNVHALLAEVGLPERCLADPDLLVPAKLAIALLELAAVRSGEPAFGLRMAASRRLSNLGPLGLLLREQPTLRLALDEVVAHIHLHSPSFSLTIVEAGEWVYLREETLLEGSPPVQQAVEMAMGTTFRILRLFLGEKWQPKMVCFRHAAPRNTTWHRKVFGNAIQFSQEFNGIVCNARDLMAANPGADPVMAKYSKRLLEMDTGVHSSMTDRVRKLIVLLLPRGHCHADLVAEHLGVTRRTVHNHLAAENTNFKSLVDGMRKDLLKRYSEEKARPLSEVASLLGFSELSALSRWHKSQFRVSVTQRRMGVQITTDQAP